MHNCEIKALEGFKGYKVSTKVSEVLNHCPSPTAELHRINNKELVTIKTVPYNTETIYVYDT